MNEPFTEETLKHLTKLSRIRCTPEEAHELVGSIQKIVTYIEKLQDVDTDGVEPCFTVIAHNENILRDDVVDNNLPRTDLLSNSPEHIGGMIRVPKVLP